MKLIKRGVALESNKDSDDFWETKLPTNLDVIIKMFKIPHSIYSIKKDLFFYLRKGLMFDGKKQYFWIDEYGKKCVLVSAEKVISPRENLNITWQSYMYHPRYYSILAVISNEKFHNVKCDIKTSMLSLGTWYSATLLFKFHFPASNLELIKIKWKTQELSVCSTHVAKLSNNWYKIPMWNFINRMPQADFYIVLEEFSIQHSSYNPHEILIQGFEFRPTNMKKQNIIDMDNDDEEYWEEKLPDEYQSFVNLSDKPLKYTTKKELYLRLCEGFLGHHGNRRMWFFLNKSARGICLMLPAKDMLEDSILNTHTVSGSRFCEVIKITSIPKLIFKCSLETFMFTPHYIYECYFVFKFQHNQTSPDDTRFLRSYCEIDSVYQGEMSVYMNLYPFNIPTIKPTNDDGSHIELSNTPLYDRVEMQKHYKSSTIIERNDGWMEFMLCKPLHQLQDHKLLRVELYGETNETFNGMIVEGIEFRPLS
ncbi:uncharacterized protein [Rutidosis leptorrhynchoides]|uniref:uncharacterized protein isoform X2 n=1 Tax=Rutidosis leptorrhynchoides TaxID=125765 RepID=UPI003A9A183C